MDRRNYRRDNFHKNNQKRLWIKAFICVAGILVLAVFASTYRNYRIKEGKAPYVRKEEVLPIMQAFCEVNGNAAYDSLDIFLQDKRNIENNVNLKNKQKGDIEKEYPSYLTYAELKQILSYFPLGDTEVLADYQKEDWYIGQEDWNQILMMLLETYGKEQIVLKEQTLLGTGSYIKDENGNPLADGLVLTDAGIFENEYWNLEMYLLSNVNMVVYNGRLLTIMENTKQAGCIRNVYLADITNEEIHLLKNGFHMFYPVTQIVQGSIAFEAGSIPRKIVDLEIERGNVVIVKEKEEYVHGKLLQITENSIEIEGYGVYPLDEEMEIYKLYGELASKEPKDLRIGYSFTDFVIEDGKIAACLMVKEEDMDSIRVLLKNSDYAGRYHDSFFAYCDQDCEIIYYENGIERERSIANAGEAISFSVDELSSVNDRIKIVPAVLSANITIESIKRSQGVPVYSGVIEITKDEEGMILVNEVLLEEYLYKVVPSEMPSSYPKEALMAQAVCARTYAYGKMINTGLPQFGAHVDDSAGFQVYNNINEQVASTDAVKSTHNIVALYEGVPIGAYYYSTSCGVGTNTEIWHGGDKSPTYLIPQMITAKNKVFQDGMDSSKENIEENGSKLNEFITPEALMQEENFVNWIQNVNFDDYEVEEGWYRWRYDVEEIDVSHMEEVLNARHESNPNLILTKQENGEFVSIPIEYLGEIIDMQITKRLAGGVADELLITGTEAVIKVISELNIRYVLCDGITKVLRQTGDEVNASSSIPSAYIMLENTIHDSRITGYKIIGGGFGHGVGMSQNGAKNMAKKGLSCEEILTLFYPGVELETLQFE